MNRLDLSFFEKKRILLLCPHHDDAVLSCGGLIRRIRNRCQDIALVNVFTRSLWAPNACSGLNEEEITTLRAGENKNYCDALQIDNYDLMLKDSMARGYDAYSELHTDVYEDPILHEIKAQVLELLDKHNPDYIICPLSHGGHIDHKILFEILRKDWTKGNLIYYEDIPYALQLSEAEIERHIHHTIGKKNAYYCDISNYIEKKIEDIFFYQSQLEDALVNEVRLCALRFQENNYFERMYF